MLITRLSSALPTPLYSTITTRHKHRNPATFTVSVPRFLFAPTLLDQNVGQTLDFQDTGEQSNYSYTGGGSGLTFPQSSYNPWWSVVVRTTRESTLE